PQPPFVQDCQKNYFFNIMATIENQKKAAELRRLLYVALTRAEKELYIIGSFSANKDVKKSLTEYDDGFGENENIFAILEAVFEDKLKKSAEKDSAITKAEYNLHNDTLFSFLLPLIVQFKDKKTPFKIESIPFRTQKDLQKIAVSAEKTSMQNVYNRVKNIFENATEIKTPIIESPYKNPSKLGKAMHAGSFLYRNDETHKNHMVTEADTITENSKGKFTYADFGTIAHIFAQAAFTGKNPMIPTHITHALSDANMKTICTVAQSMVDEFMQSTLAQEAKQALWLKTEYDFKLSIKNPALSDNKQIIVTGQIDLIYEKKDGTLVIVDYKTDSIKKPEEHVLQLSAYRHAASHMFDKDFKNIECFIYYFRSADAINISEQTLLQKE
ncbi:MAG: PD-(D/E)XK nuclease family protein, partial [Spirochaetales bacterium]